MGDRGLQLREMTQFQQEEASKHKHRTTYDDCRFNTQGQLVLQKSHKADSQSSSQSSMFTNVDLHNIQEYHDKVCGGTRKLA